MRVFDENGIHFYHQDCMLAMQEFPDKYFDLAIVDPVYGDVTGNGYTTSAHDGEAHHIGTGLGMQKAYHRAMWEQPKTPPEYFKELFRVSKNQIIWGANFFTDSLPPSQGWVVWDKQHPEGLKFSDSELAYTSFNMRQRIFRFMWNGMLQGDMKNKEKRIHVTQKPVALYRWLLENYAQKGDKILDTHVGSASSLVACYDMGFEAWGYEIDEVYYGLACERLEEEMAQIRMDICR